MQKKTWLPSAMVLILLAMFVYGVIHLFVLRFEAGDIYPPYSSLRTDPLGTKALYEGINSVRGMSAERKYRTVTKFTKLQSTTIFYIGIQDSDFMMIDPESAEMFEELIANGNRVVMTFIPNFGRMPEPGRADEEHDVSQDGEEEVDEEAPDTSIVNEPVSFADRWGVTLVWPKAEEALDEYAVKGGQPTLRDLPREISWHTTTYFENLDEAWQVIYNRNGHPVIIERPFGKGTIVLSADSYFLSNEAMRDERHSVLLSWLIASHHVVLFDETHFGVRENQGVVSLIRKYNLQWFVFSLILLALLFVWRNAFSLVPPYDERLRRGSEQGKDAMAGLVNLLRRNIAPSRVIAVCFNEWKGSFRTTQRDSANLVTHIQSIVETENMRSARERDPVACYRRICTLLAGRQYE